MEYWIKTTIIYFLKDFKEIISLDSENHFKLESKQYLMLSAQI